MSPMTTGARRTFVAAALSLLAACSSLEDDLSAASIAPVLTSDFGTMRNVSLCERIWFGTVPGLEDLDLAQRRGIHRVLDLTTAEERSSEDLAGVCRRLGITYVDFAVLSSEEMNDGFVDDVLEQMRASDDGPILMFCGSGGRCALLVAIHRAVRLDVPLERALIDARHAGMRPGPAEEIVRMHSERLLGRTKP